MTLLATLLFAGAALTYWRASRKLARANRRMADASEAFLLAVYTQHGGEPRRVLPPVNDWRYS